MGKMSGIRDCENKSGDTGGISYVEVTIYIDVLWMRTFGMELLVCIFVNLWMKQMCPTWRIIWMTAFAVSMEVLLFVIAGYGMIFASGSILFRILLVWAVFRPKSRGIFLRLFLWSLMATVAAGGMLSICQSCLTRRYWFPAGVILCALGVMLSLILEERRRQHDSQLQRVKLTHEGNTLEVIGLYDTGNRLSDPYVQKPVHILAKTEAGLLGLRTQERRLIPFSTVGKPNGLMEVWTIDVMEWTQGRCEQVVIGVADDILFEGKDYRLILSAGWKDLS